MHRLLRHSFIGTGCLMWQLSRQLLDGFTGVTTYTFLYSFVWGNNEAVNERAVLVVIMLPGIHR